MDAERAQTCLRLLAEAELRRARPGAHHSAGRIADSVQQVRWAGEILVAAGMLTEDSVAEVVTELEASLMARAGLDPQRLARRLSWICDQSASHGITAPPAAEIPGPWASVLAQRDAEPAAVDREWFAPVGTVIDIEGTRLALAGLSSAAGQSHLHVVASGLPELPIYGWGLSWWVRNGAGNWHVTAETEPDLNRAGGGAFRLRLTPPLAVRPEEIEVVVTGSVTRARAVVPVRDGRGMPET